MVHVHELTDAQLEAIAWVLHDLTRQVESIAELVAYRYYYSAHEIVEEAERKLVDKYGEQVAFILAASDELIEELFNQD